MTKKTWYVIGLSLILLVGLGGTWAYQNHLQMRQKRRETVATAHFL